MKTLLGVLAATIRGSLTLPRQTPHGLEGTSQLGDVTRPAAAEYQIFMSRGEPPLMTTPRTCRVGPGNFTPSLSQIRA